MKKNILVFPCGSEVALEVHRSMRYSTHFHLIGASSVADHGRFVFDDYVDGVPYHNAPDFVAVLARIVEQKQVDAIYPAMDAVARTLKQHEAELDCRVIGSSPETTAICASKSAIYAALDELVPCPQWSETLDGIATYPVFIKPDEGYGSRGTGLARTADEAAAFAGRDETKRLVFSELLPGDEYTIDCFSDREGHLWFAGARTRQRISNGISVSTVETNANAEVIQQAAQRINDKLQPRGAWFFQMKEDANGNPKLLEVATRLGGSSSYFRARGINFALLSSFDAFDYPVAVHANTYHVEMDRALGTTYKLAIDYDTVYVDFDDCLLIDGQVNTALVGFLYQAVNQNKRIVLLTRHEGDLAAALKTNRLTALFDDVVHLQAKEPKSTCINARRAIFIDDSHAERAEVAQACDVPVFAPDMVEMLKD